MYLAEADSKQLRLHSRYFVHAIPRTRQCKWHFAVQVAIGEMGKQ